MAKATGPIAAVAVALTAVASLSGCSGLSELGSTSVQGQEVGLAALNYSSSAIVGGWKSIDQCTQVLQNGIESHAPAGTTLVDIDPASISGPLSDPSMNSGDVATCAFKLTSATHIQNQEFFIGMPEGYLRTFAAKLVADGYTEGPVTRVVQTAGTQQLFTKNTDVVVLAYTPAASGLVSVFG